MATVPFLFFFEGEKDFFGITIIVHLPVAKFWAALIMGVHWLSRQVWSSAPTLIANVMAVARVCVQDGFLPCWKSTFSRLQLDTSGRQKNNTSPSPNQICTSILCPQHGKKNQPKQMPSRSPFPRVVPDAPGEGVLGGISGSPKARTFLDLFNGNTFQDGRPPNLCVNLKSRR